jgi:hypothetical protein
LFREEASGIFILCIFLIHEAKILLIFKLVIVIFEQRHFFLPEIDPTIRRWRPIVAIVLQKLLFTFSISVNSAS